MNVAQTLTEKGATPETILEVMTASISEVSNDKTEKEMAAELRAAVGADNSFAEMQRQFNDNPDLVREVALAWIAVAAENPRTIPAIEGAINDADRHAPLLESAALTIIAMYALYLIATGGVREEVKKIEQKPDGTFVQTTRTVYDSFSGPARAVIRMFSSIG